MLSPGFSVPTVEGIGEVPKLGVSESVELFAATLDTDRIPPFHPRYSITSRTAMTPPSLLRDDPWAESHDLRCFGKLGSKAEGGYPSWTVGTVIGGATEMSFK